MGANAALWDRSRVYRPHICRLTTSKRTRAAPPPLQLLRVQRRCSKISLTFHIYVKQHDGERRCQTGQGWIYTAYGDYNCTFIGSRRNRGRPVGPPGMGLQFWAAYSVSVTNRSIWNEDRSYGCHGQQGKRMNGLWKKETGVKKTFSKCKDKEITLFWSHYETQCLEKDIIQRNLSQNRKRGNQRQHGLATSFNGQIWT